MISKVANTAISFVKEHPVATFVTAFLIGLVVAAHFCGGLQSMEGWKKGLAVDMLAFGSLGGLAAIGLVVAMILNRPHSKPKPGA